MKSITDYPITDPYGDTTPPYSRLKPHRGNDYGLTFDPVIVAGTEIGISGNSGSYLGKTYAPHTHVQAGKDEWAQQTIDPTPYTNKKGVVVKIGWADQWGNYVCIRVGDVNVFYCHLFKTNVQVGQQIGEEMLNDGDSQNVTDVFGEKSSKFNKQAWSAVWYNYASGKVAQLKQDLKNATWIADERLKEINNLKAQQGDGSEANLLGQALIKLIASFGYKKG
jgi:hypothetical protein